MNIPIETKPALRGAVFGGAAVAIAGFSWGGWATVPGAAPEQNTEVAKACAALLISA